MHERLEQQLRKISDLLPDGDPRFAGFLAEVESAYVEADRERQNLERSLQVTTTEVLDRHLDLMRDLEKRQRLEVQLRENESKWLSLVQASPSLILTVDANLTISTSNRSFPGFQVEEMLSRPVLGFLWQEDQAAAREAFEHVWRSGTAAAFQARCDGPDRSSTIYDMQALPIFSSKKIVGLTVIATDVSERIRTLEALRRSEEQFRTMFESSPTGIVVATPDGTIVATNRTFRDLLGQPGSVLEGRGLLDLGHPDDRAAATTELHALVRGERAIGRVEMRFISRGATLFWTRTSLALARDHTGAPQRLYAMIEDVSAQKKAEAARREMEVQLRQAQKLEGIGQLAAGIAHEINTPTQFIGDNLTFLKRGFETLSPVLAACAHVGAVDGTPAANPPDLASLMKKVRWDFIGRQMPRAIEQSLEGVERVAKIVRAMKEFAHPSGSQLTPTNIRRAIENTLTVARNEWKYVADIVTDFDDSMPDLLCFGDELNQVFLNLIVNAAHAIADAAGEGSERKGTLTIRTRYDGAHAEIQFQDDGCGIPGEIRGRIFDPFFTTKEVGRGSGQGLAIAHAVVVKKHGGTIDVESQVGVGTTFIIRLPNEPPVAIGIEERAA